VRCHIHAFQCLNGVSREIFYDFVAGHKIVLLWRAALCGRERQKPLRMGTSDGSQSHNGLG
jgi:hypothetical protein